MSQSKNDTKSELLDWLEQRWERLSLNYVLIIFGIIACSSLFQIVVSENLDWRSFFNIKYNELGDFLAGLFAPLAFLILILTLRTQSEELRLQRKELSKTVAAANDQTRVQTLQAKLLEQQLINDYLDKTEKSLANIAFNLPTLSARNAANEEKKHGNFERVLSIAQTQTESAVAAAEKGSNNFFNPPTGQIVGGKANIIQYIEECRKVISNLQSDYPDSYEYWNRSFKQSVAGELYALLAIELLDKRPQLVSELTKTEYEEELINSLNR